LTKFLHYEVFKVHAASSATAYLYYHNRVILSSTFLNFFKKFFVLVCCYFISDSLIILSQPDNIVKHFLNFFQNLFSACLLLLYQRQLDYITTLYIECQYLFSTFFDKNQLSLYSPITAYIITAIRFHTAKNTYTPRALKASSTMPPIRLHTITLRLLPIA